MGACRTRQSSLYGSPGPGRLWQHARHDQVPQRVRPPAVRSRCVQDRLPIDGRCFCMVASVSRRCSTAGMPGHWASASLHLHSPGTCFHPSCEQSHSWLPPQSCCPGTGSVHPLHVPAPQCPTPDKAHLPAAHHSASVASSPFEPGHLPLYTWLVSSQGFHVSDWAHPTLPSP